MLQRGSNSSCLLNARTRCGWVIITVYYLMTLSVSQQPMKRWSLELVTSEVEGQDINHKVFIKFLQNWLTICQFISSDRKPLKRRQLSRSYDCVTQNVVRTGRPILETRRGGPAREHLSAFYHSSNFTFSSLKTLTLSVMATKFKLHPQN
jgi:hypothetical protein